MTEQDVRDVFEKVKEDPRAHDFTALYTKYGMDHDEMDHKTTDFNEVGHLVEHIDFSEFHIMLGGRVLIGGNDKLGKPFLMWFSVEKKDK